MPELNCYGSGNHRGSAEVQVKQTQCWKDGGNKFTGSTNQPAQLTLERT